MNPLVWAIHDGKIGMRNQVVGLADAVGLPFAEKRVALRFPWSRLPPLPWLEPGAALASGSDAVAPPWPDLVLACGRQGAIAALAVKRASGGRTLIAQVQDPRTARHRFDLILAPAHDRVQGANVFTTRGAVHHVTPGKLAEAVARQGPRFAGLPRPIAGVLIGGNNRVYRLTLPRLGEIADQLAALARQGFGLLVTPSRRTGAAGERLLRERLDGLPVQVWDGSGENPYLAILGLADALIVTGDSVSMVSEAASTGKPVHVIDLPGGSAKFRRFHAAFRAAGITRPFVGRIETWRYEPLDDTARAAAVLRRLVERTRHEAAA